MAKTVSELMTQAAQAPDILNKCASIDPIGVDKTTGEQVAEALRGLATVYEKFGRVNDVLSDEATE